MSKISQLRSRLPLKAIIPILLISTLSIVSYASNVSVQSQTYKGVGGATFNVSGDYIVESLGFLVAPQDYGNHLTWGSIEPITQGVEEGHWMYSFKLVPGDSATLPISVSVSWSRGGSDYEAMGPVGEPMEVTGDLDDAGEQIFVIDVDYGFEPPVAIVITVE